MRPLTNTIPKVMVELFGKTLLEHNMDRLVPYVDEFIIVVKHLPEKITEPLGNEYMGIPIRYHIQGDEKGTGAAIKGIDVEGDLIIAYTDGIVSQEDIDKEMRSPHSTVLVQIVQNPEKYGIFCTDEAGFATDLVEKPSEYVGNLANFGFFKINSEIISIMETISPSVR